MHPLEGKDPALLLLDLSPCEYWVRYVKANARRDCDNNGYHVEYILKQKLMEEVGGHPGTLVSDEISVAYCG